MIVAASSRSFSSSHEADLVKQQHHCLSSSGAQLFTRQAVIGTPLAIMPASSAYSTVARVMRTARQSGATAKGAAVTMAKNIQQVELQVAAPARFANVLECRWRECGYNEVALRYYPIYTARELHERIHPHYSA